MGIDQTKNKNLGALFKNENRTAEKAPLLTGKIELDRRLVLHLHRLIEDGEPAVLTLGGWKNVSRNGVPYYTIKATPEYRPPEATLALEDHDEIDL